MQCVILAAGKGTRMKELTADKPKPLIAVCGKPLLSHIIDALPPEVDDIIMVIGYKGELLQSEFGELYEGRRMRYVHQEVQAGPADALLLCKDMLQGRFMMLFCDDIHGKEDLAKLVASPTAAILAKEHHNPKIFGVIELQENGTLDQVVEKPEFPKTNLVYTGPAMLDTHIFDYEAPVHANGERYTTDLFTKYAKEYPLAVIVQDLWIPVGYPEDIEKAEAILCPED